jgi:hypothetical protein
MNHVGITTGCFSCHNNARVEGQPPDHPFPLAISRNCELCHNTTSWK